MTTRRTSPAGWRRLTTIAPAALIALLLPVGVGHAAHAAPAASAAPATTANGVRLAANAEGEPARLELVMDSSGSMKEPAEGGVTKIEAAKQALGKVIDSVPADQQVGLRVYGASVFSKDDAGACTDSQLQVPLGTGNADAMRAAVAKYRPYGETPIGYALQEAGKDLGDSGRRNILLVSDGVPTCEPDPCEVARELSKQGIDLQIDVVGLAVNSAARDALQCVADAGGGTYYDAQNSEQLTDSMVRIQERAARPYVPIGKPVTGSAGPDDAPVVTPGDWLDQTDGSGDSRYYRVQRTLEGSTLIASAAYRSAGPDANGADVTLTTEDGAQCAAGAGATTLGRMVTAAAAATEYAAQQSATAGCFTEPQLIMEVSTEGAPDGSPLEMRIDELGRVTDLDALPPAAANGAAWQAPKAAAQRSKVVGGTSFADAEALKPGSYRGTIVPGETLTFTVDADWGQQPTALVGYAPLGAGLAPAGDGGPATELNIYAPGRSLAEDIASQATLEGVVGDSVLSTTGGTLGATTPPVNYALLENPDVAGLAGEAGAYTITLYLEDTTENPSIPVPFDLDVAVNGTANDGPTFDDTAIEGVSDTGSETADPSAEPTTEPSDDDGSSEASAGDSDDAGGISPVSAAVGGAGVVALIGAGVLLVRSRRRA